MRKTTWTAFFVFVSVTTSACSVGEWFNELTGVDLLEAYALQNQVAPGAVVAIAARAVPSVEADWKVERIGWYGGAGSHKYDAGTISLTNQPVPDPDTATGLVEAGWKPILKLKTIGWPAGAYVVTLTAGRRKGRALFVIDDGKHHDFLLQISVTTYGAYNDWGGLSLYSNRTSLPLPRAVRVSLDRPFLNGGLGDFDDYEKNLILWMDRAGYDFGYTTNLGVDGEKDLASRTQMLISSGHDEYWSRGERDNVDAAVANGMHLTALSGNSAYWQINLLPAADGRPKRVIECYRTGPEAERTQTLLWRQVPGQTQGDLLGVVFGWIVDSWAPLLITDTSHPFFIGTDIRPGDSFDGVMGHEIDGYDPQAAATVLGRAPLLDNMEALGEGTVVVRTLDSGAQIFSASSLRWADGLNGPYESYRLQKFTANVLKAGGNPAHSPVFAQEIVPPQVHRWLESTVTTIATGVNPRSIVKYGERILYIENGTRSVRELLPTGQSISFAETDTELTGMTVDGSGNIWATDVNTDSVWRYENGAFLRVSSGVPGVMDGVLAKARFSTPVQIHAVRDRIVVTEHNRAHSRVRVIHNGIVSTLPDARRGVVVYTALPLEVGPILLGLSDNTLVSYRDGRYTPFSGATGGWNDAQMAVNTRFRTPYYMVPTEGGYYLIERYGHRLRFVTSDGGAYSIAGSAIGMRDGRGDEARFRLPYGLVEVEKNVLYVTDAGNGAIRKVVLHERPLTPSSAGLTPHERPRVDD